MNSEIKTSFHVIQVTPRSDGSVNFRGNFSPDISITQQCRDLCALVRLLPAGSTCESDFGKKLRVTISQEQTPRDLFQRVVISMFGQI